MASAGAELVFLRRSHEDSLEPTDYGEGAATGGGAHANKNKQKIGSGSMGGKEGKQLL